MVTSKILLFPSPGYNYLKMRKQTKASTYIHVNTAFEVLGRIPNPYVLQFSWYNRKTFPPKIIFLICAPCRVWGWSCVYPHSKNTTVNRFPYLSISNLSLHKAIINRLKTFHVHSIPQPSLLELSASTDYQLRFARYSYFVRTDPISSH